MVDAVYSADAPKFEERSIEAFYAYQLREVDPLEFGCRAVLVSNEPY